MNRDELFSNIEAILFAAGEPIECRTIASVLESSEEEIAQCIDELNKAYTERKNAFRILKLSDTFQMTVDESFIPTIQKTFEKKSTAPLSQAAMEALTIVAYNQPVTKSFVENVRGVDSSGVMNSLVEKKLIEEDGRLDLPGRPIAYRTTTTFLRSFCLESLDDLPEIPITIQNGMTAEDNDVSEESE